MYNINLRKLKSSVKTKGNVSKNFKELTRWCGVELNSPNNHTKENFLQELSCYCLFKKGDKYSYIIEQFYCKKEIEQNLKKFSEKPDKRVVTKYLLMKILSSKEFSPDFYETQSSLLICCGFVKKSFYTLSDFYFCLLQSENKNELLQYIEKNIKTKEMYDALFCDFSFLEIKRFVIKLYFLIMKYSENILNVLDYLSNTNKIYFHIEKHSVFYAKDGETKLEKLEQLQPKEKRIIVKFSIKRYYIKTLTKSDVNCKKEYQEISELTKTKVRKRLHGEKIFSKKSKEIFKFLFY